MQPIRIEWEGPFSVDDVIAKLDNKDDYGLYQIYGKHIIFGENSLLYIGMTDKTFSNKLKGTGATRSGMMKSGERYLSELLGCRERFSKMLRHLKSTGIHRHIIQLTSTTTMAINCKL